MDSASLRPEAADSFAVRAALLVDGGNAHLKSLTAMKVRSKERISLISVKNSAWRI